MYVKPLKHNVVGESSVSSLSDDVLGRPCTVEFVHRYRGGRANTVVAI